MRKKILISGGFGFIGKHIVKKLAQDKDTEIIILSLKRKKTVLQFFRNFSLHGKINIVNTNIVKKGAMSSLMNGVDTVIHLAAQTRIDTSPDSLENMLKINILGTTRLLESALYHGIKKFIFFSTSGVYGDKLKNESMDGISQLDPFNFYVNTKFAAEKIALAFYKAYNFPIVILRVANAYGPYQSPPWMIPLFIDRVSRNLPIILYHEGKPRRDWIYVNDVVSVVEKILHSSSDQISGQIFNVGTGKTVSNREVANLIAKELGKKSSLIIPSKTGPKEIAENIVVIDKIKKMMGWQPTYSLKDGLRETIRWYRDNTSRIVTTPIEIV